MDIKQKYERKIKILREEIDRLDNDNCELIKKNDELTKQLNDFSTQNVKEQMLEIERYKNELSNEIENVLKLKEAYNTLIEKQKKFYRKEKSKYKKATNKTIADFNKSLK